MAESIRIGGASGFWGDSSIAAPQLLGSGVDYLVFDYLAEITMSILARARAKDPNAGYAQDFIEVVRRNLDQITRGRVKVIANAGGVNPLACAAAMRKMLADQGSSLKVGVVTGDDLINRAADFRNSGIREMFSNEPFPQELLSANAYLGAFPIAEALDLGADIVITGRCVDAALTLGPSIHAFGWQPQELDLLAGGALAGHIIECGAQASGGIHTDWEKTGDWANIGYPIATVFKNGCFEISKPAGTGGLVSYGTIAEQLVYEIGDPAAYVLPDVVCDFSEVHLKELCNDRVRVEGARGLTPTQSYKVSATFQAGYRVGAYLTLAGIDAVKKAEKVADAVVRRCTALLANDDLPAYDEVSVEILGSECFYGAASQGLDSREVLLKLAAKHKLNKPLDLLMRELTSSGTSMAPGITVMGGNRPKVSPLVRLFSFLVPKSDIPVQIHIGDRVVAASCGSYVGAKGNRDRSGPMHSHDLMDCNGDSVPLLALAWARSGDKGNLANIGVIARRSHYLPYIRAALTPEVVGERFKHFVSGRTDRYELPGLNALNFVMHDALGGGGIASLRGDPQGKTYAQIILDHPIPVPPSIVAEVRGSPCN